MNRACFHVAVALTLTTALVRPVAGAPGDHAWSKGFDTYGVASVDGSGYVVSAGSLTTPVDFGGGTLTPVNNLNGDLYMVRYDAAGAHVWSQQFTPVDFSISISQCATDPAGNIFIAGVIQGPGSINFGGGTLSGPDNMFLAAFNSAGGHLWSLTVGPGFVQSLAASATHVYCTGYTYGTMDFGGGPMTSAGGADMFVGALSTAGSHAFSSLYGDASGQGGMAVAVDLAGNVLLAAGIEGTVDFGGGPLTSSAATDLCIAKLTGAGAHVWSQMFAGTFSSGAGILLTAGLATGLSSEVALVGQASGTVNFGGGPLTATGAVDVFIAKFGSNGGHQWSAMYGGSTSDGASGAAFDPSGNLWVAGKFNSSSMSLGGGTLTHSGGFGSNLFAAAYDAGGSHVWSRGYGSGSDALPHAFPSGDILLSGGAAPGVDFGGGPLAIASTYLARLHGSATASVGGPRQSAVSFGAGYPNPFRSSTIVPFSLGGAAEVRLEVMDAAGRRVATLIDGPLPAGAHTARWDGRTSAGRSAPSGVYLYRLSTDGAVHGRQVVRVE